ncbi:MAG: hypothetical protein ACK5X3_22710 [Pseudomonadota bacterium]|jgi:hypothetical protein
MTNYTQPDPLKSGDVRRAYDDLVPTRRMHNNFAESVAREVDPRAFPPETTSDGDTFLQPAQWEGSLGHQAFVGRYVANAFPATGEPWLKFDIDDAREQNADPEVVQKARARTDAHSRTINNRLYTANTKGLDSGGFQRRMHAVATQLSIVGGCIVRGLPGLRVEVIDRRRYVVHRDQAGDVEQIITTHRIDPLRLPADRMAKIQLPEKWMEKKIEDRRVVVYTSQTQVMEGDDKGKFKLVEECNGNIIFEQTTPVATMWNPCWSLTQDQMGEVGAMGYCLTLLQELAFVQDVIRKLTALNTDVAVGIDNNMPLSPRQLFGGEWGRTIRGVNVTPDGRIGNIGVLELDKSAALREAYQYYQTLRQTAFQVFGIGSSVAPQKERVTAEQINMIRSDISERSYSLLIASYDSLMQPMALWAYWQAIKDGIIELPEEGSPEGELLSKTIIPRVLTGTATIASQRRLEKIYTMYQATSVIPDFGKTLNNSIIGQQIVTDIGLDIPGAVRTEAEMRAKEQEAIQMQTNAQAQLAGVNAAAQAQQSIMEQQGTGG